MTTLITGAFGCIGAWVIRGLLAGGERPVVFDLGDDPWRVRMIAGPDAPERLTVVRGDITDKGELERVVRDHGVRRIVHLAAWQVPLCRQDPPRGASINVTGTANVFEVARASAGQVERVVYASSAAVFGAPSLYPPGPIKDDAPPRPATHYGVYKVANEETARIYWEEHRIGSAGFRPLTVYGPGRDFGLTAIEAAWPPAKELITHVEQALPFPAALDDARYQKDLGPVPSASLAAGVQKRLDEFERLRQRGRLGARELT